MTASRPAVGGQYIKGRTGWPEVNHLTINKAAIEISLFCKSPSPELCEAVDSKTVHFSWVDNPGVAVVQLAFAEQDVADGSKWFSIVYTPHTEMIGRGLPPGSAGQPIKVTVTLVDATTGVVAAVRELTWSAEMSDFVRARLSSELTQNSSPASIRDFVQRARKAVSGTESGFTAARRWSHT